MLNHDDRDTPAVKGVSFEVKAGEVLGVAGVQGNGQTELVEALTGLREVESGTVRINGQAATHATPRQITEMGVAHIPEDRQQDGLVLTFPIKDNMILNTYYSTFSKGLVIDEGKVDRVAAELVKDFDVRTPSIDLPASTLSGGNQQKVIVAREFSRPINLLIAAQPTRGVDIGAAEYIHTRLVAARATGTAIVVISEDLDEVLALSDRVAVMFEGTIVGTVDPAVATREEIGLMMAGVVDEG